jgi:hypothetical protein
MDEIHATTPVTLVIHGACTDRETKKLTGADRWAEEWAIEREVPYMACRPGGQRKVDQQAHGVTGAWLQSGTSIWSWRCLAGIFHVVAIRHQNVGVRRKPSVSCS